MFVLQVDVGVVVQQELGNPVSLPRASVEKAGPDDDTSTDEMNDEMNDDDLALTVPDQCTH